ncbi:histidine kinase dimerization/phosphoacceptor domain -containing protein [Bradyrhizobium sp. USDA 3262]
MNRLSPLVLKHRLPTPVRYGISASIMLGCAILQMALQMQTGSPGYLLLPGVFLSGLIFDRRSGIFAAIIAVAVGAYVSYAGSLGIDYFATNALFAITAAGTAAVAEFQRAELRRVVMADKTKALLLQEMAHRTKNNLTILGGMIRLEARPWRSGGRGCARGYRAPAAGDGGGLGPSIAEAGLTCAIS